MPTLLTIASVLVGLLVCLRAGLILIQDARTQQRADAFWSKQNAWETATAELAGHR